MRVGVLAVSRTVLHPALSSLGECSQQARVISGLFFVRQILSRIFCYTDFVARFATGRVISGCVTAGRVAVVLVASGCVFFSPATRVATGRVVTRVAARRVFSSLPAAFVITLSFF